jgi:hypothetical protein
MSGANSSAPSAPRTLVCEMGDCSAEVTHIGSKGYVYCAAHGAERTRSMWTSETARKMRPWEVALLRAGQPLMSYTPISQSLDTHMRQSSSYSGANE